MPRRYRIPIALAAILLAGLACTIPFISPDTDLTPDPSGTKTSAGVDESAKAPDTPPTLVERQPSANESLPLNARLVLYFDQPMDQPSVEAAFRIEPAIAGQLVWQDSSTVRFEPNQPLSRATSYRVQIGAEAQAASGLALLEAIDFEVQTAGPIEIVSISPPDGAQEVNPETQFTVVFNQPIVPLQLEGEGPQPLLLEPSAAGQGSWLSSSIYQFKPNAPLPAGLTITARIDPSLSAPTEVTFNQGFSWSFTTAQPRLVEAEPAPEAGRLALDPELELSFNQRMDAGSVEAAFNLLDSQSLEIAGAFNWNDDQTALTFIPDAILEYDSSYVLELGAEARSAGGSPLAEPLRLVYQTVPLPAVDSSLPAEGGIKSIFASLEIHFSAPMDQASLLESISVEPEIENLGTSWNDDENTLIIRGDFQPSTTYTLSLAQEALDRYGTSLAAPFELNFQTEALAPQLAFNRFTPALTLSADRTPSIELQTRNIEQLDLRLYSLNLETYFNLAANNAIFSPPDQGTGATIRQWGLEINSTLNQTQAQQVTLQDDPLPSGLYLLTIDTPTDNQSAQGRLIVVRNTELVLKTSANEAFVWAVDLASGESLADLPITLLDETGAVLATGQTDPEGLLRLPIDLREQPYQVVYASSGEPAQAGFGFTGASWADGIQAYEFQINQRLDQDLYKLYLYSDRPIYRPGHTIHYRGILRQVLEGSYELPDISQVEVDLIDARGQLVAQQSLSLNAFGSIEGRFQLSQEAPLGPYILRSDYGDLLVDVAAYRRPEFSVSVEPDASEVSAGSQITATIQAQTYFGTPVSGAEVTWYAFSGRALLPDLPQPLDWFQGAQGFQVPFGAPALDGSGVTDAEGRLEIQIPAELLNEQPTSMLIEATVVDQSELPVSGSAQVTVHPAEIYFDLDPERYNLRVGETAEIVLRSVDWQAQAVANQSVQVAVERLTWRQIVDADGRIRWESQATLENEANLTTGADGSVRFSFVPQQGGSFRARASGEDQGGRQTSADLQLWVAGEGAGIWRQPPAGRLALVPDRARYSPGQTARVLVPSPFEGQTVALVTLERESVLSHQILTLQGPDPTIEVPLEMRHAPNAYLSVTLIRPGTVDTPPALAFGLVELQIDASEFRLDVSLTSNVDEAGPGDPIQYTLQARDAAGQPVEAEFSLALVDKAVLALAPENSAAPFEALYANRPLGVRTGASLALSAETEVAVPPVDGVGGGGGGPAMLEVRQDFPDTAFWRASIVTDAEGQAVIDLTLPDSLTTWRMQARGVTMDTRVGSAEVELLTSKALMIRPITPRFFTAGDAATVGALINNNTEDELEVQASLLAGGATIVDEAQRDVLVPAGGEIRLDWALIIGDVEQVELTFSAAGGGLEDASRPTVGSADQGGLPVLRFSAPDTVASAGALTEAGQRLEVVNLPRSFEPSQGELRVQLDPAIGAALAPVAQNSDDPTYLSSEALISRLFIDLSAFRAAGALGLDPDQQRAILINTLAEVQSILGDRQGQDGGWSWWGGFESPSNPAISAYVIYGLAQVQDAGLALNPVLFEQGIAYLQTTLLAPDQLNDGRALNRQAFSLLALAVAGQGDLETSRRLASQLDRMPLDGQAILALTLIRLAPDDPQINTILSNFENAAARSATGSHWQANEPDRWNMGNAIRTTALVMLATAPLDPGDPDLASAARWLLAARGANGRWRTNHEDAWAVFALSEWLLTLGEGAPNYEYSLALNDLSLSEGSASAVTPDSSQTLNIPLDDLLSSQPNSLLFERGEGQGVLHYSAHLTAYRPVEQVEASSRGLSVERAVFLYDGSCGDPDHPCPVANSATVGDDLLVRVTLLVPDDQYFIVLEDPFPAGAEPLDPGLLTSPSSADPGSLHASDPLRGSWGWWWFSRSEMRDDRLLLFADFLPAGSYQFSYLLRATFSGEYRMIPTRAWATYFPEVYAQGEGRVFSIQPR